MALQELCLSQLSKSLSSNDHLIRLWSLRLLYWFKTIMIQSLVRNSGRHGMKSVSIFFNLSERRASAWEEIQDFLLLLRVFHQPFKGFNAKFKHRMKSEFLYFQNSAFNFLFELSFSLSLCTLWVPKFAQSFPCVCHQLHCTLVLINQFQGHDRQVSMKILPIYWVPMCLPHLSSLITECQ